MFSILEERKLKAEVAQHMIIYKEKDYKDMSRRAANIISAQVILKPNCVLGLATGSSPIGAYKQLIEWYQKGDIDFSQVRTINLDEYKGLTKENSQSYYYFMNENFFKHINIDPQNTNIPNGMAEDDEAECERYNQVLKSLGGIDLQLLGIGHNGHIGFNEPEQAFEKDTHCVALQESTIKANSRLFENPEEVPRYAYTMGIKTIMLAKKIVVIVSGEDKADIVQKAFFGAVTPSVPASILQMHNDVVLIGDEAALSKIDVDAIRNNER
jgi:glucosamine-6-phosphate deaminase